MKPRLREVTSNATERSIRSRWGPLADEMLRQARVAAGMIKHPGVHPGIAAEPWGAEQTNRERIPDPTPVTAKDARRAREHLLEAMRIIGRGRIFPDYERPVWLLIAALKRYAPPRGRRLHPRAVFAWYIIQWARWFLPAFGGAKRLQPRDLVLLAESVQMDGAEDGVGTREWGDLLRKYKKREWVGNPVPVI